VAFRALAQAASSISEHEMNKTNAALARIAVADGSAPYSAYFADRESIDGKITVVDLTDGACRCRPAIRATSRHSATAARPPAGLIASVTPNSPICREPPDWRPGFDLFHLSEVDQVGFDAERVKNRRR
jgi:hypothetical protein